MKYVVTLKKGTKHTITAKNLDEAEEIADAKFKTWIDVKMLTYDIPGDHE